MKKKFEKNASEQVVYELKFEFVTKKFEVLINHI